MLSSNTSAVSGDTTYIEDVFSTYLYTGTGATQTITNGVDLSTKGGMVWIKSRSYASSNTVFDTSRGVYKSIYTDSTTSQDTFSDTLTAFNTNGFTLGSDALDGKVNTSPRTYTSWTFRKQPKFFDVVTYTGNGVSGRKVAHNLGSVPGAIFVKATSATSDWCCMVRASDTTYASFLSLNTTGASAYTGVLGDPPTATEFTTNSLGNSAGSYVPNENGVTYVAYFFAHNAGGFGLTGTDNVISCGSYTGTGAAGNAINLGYEPQWVLIKNSTAGSYPNWFIFDNMRGMAVGAGDPYLYANSSQQEFGGSAQYLDPTATGFNMMASNVINESGQTYIYIAIRRGPMKVPTDATKVFAPLARTGTGSTYSVTSLSFPPDLIHSQSRDAYGANAFYDRLRGGSKILFPNATGAEGTDASISSFDQNGFSGSGGADYANNVGTPYVFHAMRRAPSFFDEVCYIGTGANQNWTHNLGVVPELMIAKSRSFSAAYTDWIVYTSKNGSNKIGFLDLDAAFQATPTNVWPSDPTSSVFTVGASPTVNSSGNTYVAYLFATCAGVSKCFNYTGNGSSQTINCGFTGGARWIMIKRTDSTGDWYIWDSSRGIVSGNDPHLSLNTTAAEVTSDDTIDTDSTGFIVNQLSATNVNVTSATYIGIAIA